MMSMLSLSTEQEPPRYRPWEQKDLLNRLKTYKPRTWFGKPLQINAVTCARYGWINVGPDTLKCEASKEYADRLVSGHAESCPWRDTVCDAKLGKFPKLPPRDVYSDFEQRYAHIDSLMQLPALSQDAIRKLEQSHRQDVGNVCQQQLQAKSFSPVEHRTSDQHQTVKDLFEGFAEQGNDAFVKRACLLAACGWDAFQLKSLAVNGSSPQSAAGPADGACQMQEGVLACSMCGSKVGLWSYVGDSHDTSLQDGLQTNAIEGLDQHEEPAVLALQSDSEHAAASAAAADTTAAAAAAAAPAAQLNISPEHRQSIRRSLSNSIAGGPIASPVSNAQSPDGFQPFDNSSSSSPPVPQTAASTSDPQAPFQSPFPQAPFGSPFPAGSAQGSAHRHAPFGSPLQAPAFGSGSFGSGSFGSGKFDSPAAWFTPAASIQPQARTAAPDSTAAFGNMAFDTPQTVFGTPASQLGTPLSRFGSPGFQTPRASMSGTQPFGTPRPAFGSGAFGRSALAFGTPAMPQQQSDKSPAENNMGNQPDAAMSGPFGTPAFGGAAAMPAFGMAVFKSPPQSRSPSADPSQPPPPPPSTTAAPASATPVPAHATAVALSATDGPITTTAAPAADPAAGLPGSVHAKAVTAAAKAQPSAAAAADADAQPSGFKRKRSEEVAGNRHQQGQHSVSKQARLAGAAGKGSSAAIKDASQQAFDPLKSHKSFCPWVNMHTEEPASSTCGWQWYLRSLATHWDRDPSASQATPSQARSQRLQQALASISRGTGTRQ